MSSFPTVATVMGVSKEVVESGPLFATLAIDPNIIAAPPPPPEPMDIKVNDPVTQAVVDNITGKLPTKKEPVQISCDVCHITVTSLEALEIHNAGSKHAKKLKSKELLKEIFNSDYASNGSGTQFSCKICNIQVNSSTQLQQHLTGTKHKRKEESSKSNTISLPNSNGIKGAVSVNIGPNRLYCATCNVNFNSDIQLHQHMSSTKHANKVNGVRQPFVKRLAPGKKPWVTNRARGVGAPVRGWTGSRGGAAGFGGKRGGARGWGRVREGPESRFNAGWGPSMDIISSSWTPEFNLPQTSYVQGNALFSRRM